MLENRNLLLCLFCRLWSQWLVRHPDNAFCLLNQRINQTLSVGIERATAAPRITAMPPGGASYFTASAARRRLSSALRGGRSICSTSLCRGT